MLYLAVDDIDATIERLRGSGVTIEHEPHVIFSHADDTLGPAGTDEWQAFVRDCEGNLVGLVEQRRPHRSALVTVVSACCNRIRAVAARSDGSRSAVACTIRVAVVARPSGSDVRSQRLSSRAASAAQ